MSLKSALEALLCTAVDALRQQGVCAGEASQKPGVERTRDHRHGDFTTNAAMLLAAQAGMPPRELAQRIIAAVPASALLQKIEVAGPGFVNFYLQPTAYLDLIETIRTQAQQYGRADFGAGKSVMLEFVSANPTGPLHVGHGRAAAYGDALARVLKAAGYRVHSEYYVNDAGRQMDILALSVWLRYLQTLGRQLAFPSNGYQGEYVQTIAAALQAEVADRLPGEVEALFAELPDDDDARIDQLIARCKAQLGADGYLLLFNCGRDRLVEDIRQDLAEFGVLFDRWFAERELLAGGHIETAIEVLERQGHVYEKAGAKWFRATRFGDEKDRVVLRANGAHTYFAADMAYHFNKAERGFDMLLDVFGADHHGYVERIKSAFEALGQAPGKLEVLLVQFVKLHRSGEKISMSTRGGDFVTLRELRAEVGNDAARFFYVLRRPDQHMDFDLELAKSQSSDNPVYYIQYAHARICSVHRQAEQLQPPGAASPRPDYGLLVEVRERELLRTLSRFPEVVALAASRFEPHQVAYYLRDLATAFHAYYNAHPFLASAPPLRLARLGLIDAVRQVIANGLSMLGVDAPESM